jgi:HAD superfamily hydrolase (TIGR01450 family)
LGTTAGPLVGEHDLVLLDLDGVVYAGPAAIPGAPNHLSRCREAGARLGFVTNNASRPPASVARHLRDIGVDAADTDVVTAAQAAARLVADAVPPGSAVLVVGGEGLEVALAEHDLTVVESALDAPAAVVQGLHPTVGWAMLAEGAYALADGIPWIASNLDPTVPTERGRAPGNGALVDVLRATSGRAPQVAGKPEPALFHEAQRRLGGDRTLVVGDRLDTDIAGASRAGLPSLLVLTGVSALAELCTAVGDDRPTFVAPDLAGLLVGHPEVESTDGGARCGRWMATVVDGALQLTGPDAPERGPDSAVTALRAAVAACWAYRDARSDGGSTSKSGSESAAEEPDNQGRKPQPGRDTVDVCEAERQLHEMMT